MSSGCRFCLKFTRQVGIQIKASKAGTYLVDSATFATKIVIGEENTFKGKTGLLGSIKTLSLFPGRWLFQAYAQSILSGVLDAGEQDQKLSSSKTSLFSLTSIQVLEFEGDL